MSSLETIRLEIGTNSELRFYSFAHSYFYFTYSIPVLPPRLEENLEITYFVDSQTSLVVLSSEGESVIFSKLHKNENL